MSTQKVRIQYEVDKKQLDESNKSLEKSVKGNDVLQKEVDQTTDKFEKQEKQLGKTNSAFAGVGGNLKTLANRFTIAGKGAGDLASGMFAATKATSGTSKAMRVLKVAIASTGIGLLIVALGSLAAAFKSSETGQNKFAKLMATIGVIVGNVSDIFANIGEKIIEAFESPKATINSFVNLLRTNVINRFNGLLELVPKLGTAITQLFSGDFSGAAQTATDAVAKVTLGVEDFSQKAVDGFSEATEAVQEFTKQTQKEVAQAQALADKRAETDILARKFLVDTARLEGQVADLRLKGRKEDEFTAEQRLAFLKEANDIQNQLIETELTIARNRAEEATISNTFSKSTKENLDEEAQLIAAVFQVETKRLNQQRTLQREINTTSKQAEAAIASEEKARQKQVEEEAKSTEAIAANRRSIQTETDAYEAERAGNAEEALRIRTSSILENTQLTEDERRLIIQQSEDEIQQIRQSSAQQQIAVGRTAVSQLFSTLSAFSDLRLSRLEEDQARELELAGDNASERERIEEEFGERIAEERTKAARIDKAASIFGALNNTALGVTSALSIPLGLGIPLAAVIGGLGAAQVAAIAARPLPQFEEGGRIGGKRHSQGGTIIEAETGEHVMNRKATSKYGHDFFDKVNNLELNEGILNGRSGGSSVTIVDTKPIADAMDKRPVNEININEAGFNRKLIKDHYTMSEKLNRYST